MDNLPFTFVEKQLTAKNTKLDPITDETIRKYLLLVTERVEKRVATDLPENFGIVIDGWKEVNRSEWDINLVSNLIGK